MRYPTREGIAVPLFELDLPGSRYWDKERHSGNHHNEWSSKNMAKLAVTQCLRDLERHQFVIPRDVHEWLHDRYDPPKLPTEEQAAREVINAYEKGERFKRYSKQDSTYHFHEIPPEVVDRFMQMYGIKRVYMAAD